MVRALFESKVQGHQFYDAWLWKVMAILQIAAKMLTTGMKKGIDCPRIRSITRDHQDLEFDLAVECGEPHVVAAQS